MLPDLLNELLKLAGFGALVSMVVNLLKTVGVIKDGQSQTWVSGLNLLGLVVLWLLRSFFPEVDLAKIDEELLVAVNAIGPFLFYVLSFLISQLGSKITYKLFRGTKVIGKSYSV